MMSTPPQDPCATKTCLNNGQCYVAPDGMPKCDCDGTGYEGRECQGMDHWCIDVEDGSTEHAHIMANYY